MEAAQDDKTNRIDLHVGERIRLRRKALNLTQQGLAVRVGLTFQQIQKYERGFNRVSASRLYAIAQQLSVPVAHFFEGLDQDQRREDDGEKSILRLLEVTEGADLARAFPTIKRRNVRRQFLALVRALSESERGDTESRLNVVP